MNFQNKPNFFVIGVVKGGTTSLYHYLSQHPDIYLPQIKETNHFAAADISEKDFLKEYKRDVKIDMDRYIKSGMNEIVHIAHVNNNSHYEALFSKVNGERAIGEISNSYMICPSAAKFIHQFNREARIIVILRNPIKRAWSQYLMKVREAKSNAENFIQELKQDHDKSPKGWGVNHQYLELGNYSGQLKRYYDYFDKDQVLPIFFEDFQAELARVLHTICDFLGVDHSFKFDFSEKSNASALPRNAVLNRFLVRSGIFSTAKRITPKKLRQKFSATLYSEKNIPKLSQNDSMWLREYYQNEVKRLSELLGFDVSEKWTEFKLLNER